MKLTVQEACDLLYRGKSNIPNAAKLCGTVKEDMFGIFSEYAKAIPIDEDDWKCDVEPGWPHA
jgi:hypothetical protein